MSLEIVLASGSVWRRGLLEAVGIPCEAIAPVVDEDAITADSPREVARARALAKALAVAPGVREDRLIIGADQVVHLEGRILGKPCDRGEHLSMLQRLRGQRHELITAVALVARAPSGSVLRRFEVVTSLEMRADLSDEELAAYVANGEAAGCGGGYMVESQGAQLFAAVEGDWNNVVGLPVFELITALRELGWRPAFVPRAPRG